MEEIDISTEADTMTMKHLVYEPNRKTPYKYLIRFNRSELQSKLNNDSGNAFAQFTSFLEMKVKIYHEDKMSTLSVRF